MAGLMAYGFVILGHAQALFDGFVPVMPAVSFLQDARDQLAAYPIVYLSQARYEQVCRVIKNKLEAMSSIAFFANQSCADFVDYAFALTLEFQEDRSFSKFNMIIVETERLKDFKDDNASHVLVRVCCCLSVLCMPWGGAAVLWLLLLCAAACVCCVCDVCVCCACWLIPESRSTQE